MHDGHTRKLDRGDAARALFLAQHRVTLVALDGAEAGTEYEVETDCATIGRGPEVTFGFADDAMSRQHAALELGADGFRLRDLGSTNGITVNGSSVEAADLKHGDKIGLGEHTLQYIVERRGSVRAYELAGDE